MIKYDKVLFSLFFLAIFLFPFTCTLLHDLSLKLRIPKAANIAVSYNLYSKSLEKVFNDKIVYSLQSMNNRRVIYDYSIVIKFRYKRIRIILINYLCCGVLR